MSVSDLATKPNRLAAVAAAWKTLLVHVEPGANGGAQLEVAAKLAEDLDALLVGVGAEALEPALMAEPYMGTAGQLLSLLQVQVEEDLVRAEQAFRVGAARVRHVYRSFEARPVPTLAAMSRSADLIVAAAAAEGDSYRRASPAELAIASGRPVLVVPEDASPLRAEVVLIAWKDSREARRAISDALPLLKSAAEVLVAAVCDKDALDETRPQIEDVALGLKRHGVNVRTKAVTGAESHATDLLKAEARAIEADLIVAGCYGRSRVNEWIFGGVTRDLLRHPKHYLLLSH